MRLYNDSDRELVLPDGTRLMPDQATEVDEEKAKVWGNHPVLQAWVKDGWIEAEFPDANDDEEDGEEKTPEVLSVEGLADTPRSKLVRYLKEHGLNSRGKRPQLEARVKEHLEAAAAEE